MSRYIETHWEATASSPVPVFGCTGENVRMRKRILAPGLAVPQSALNQGWLDLSQIATVEVTSEDVGFPIDGAFESKEGRGWRAGTPGEQQIRIIFDNPVSLHRIELRFDEPDVQRTQEFILRWCSELRGVWTEIVRQQWNFSPEGSTTEIESYVVDLQDVLVLELAILPHRQPHSIFATLASWRLR